jgi:hypothetical protein
MASRGGNEKAGKGLQKGCPVARLYTRALVGLGPAAAARTPPALT